MSRHEERIQRQVKHYYERKLAAHGATPRGVDWNSVEAQEIRFKQLLKLCRDSAGFTINDYGCGYGALAAFMAKNRYECSYHGYDISQDMIQAARAQQISGEISCRFTTNPEDLARADYVVASGLFSVRLRCPPRQWKSYVVGTLRRFNQLSERGFAFNMLTRYSDRPHMRSDLYYADPLYFFDYCKKHFAKQVALLHDYGIYEFTILVRKEG